MLLAIFVFNQAHELPHGVVWSLIKQIVNQSFLAPNLYALNSDQEIAMPLKRFCLAQLSFQTAAPIEADLKFTNVQLGQQ